MTGLTPEQLEMRRSGVGGRWAVSEREALPPTETWLPLIPPVPDACHASDVRLPPCDGPGALYVPDEIHPHASVCVPCAERLMETRR